MWDHCRDLWGALRCRVGRHAWGWPHPWRDPVTGRLLWWVMTSTCQRGGCSAMRTLDLRDGPCVPAPSKPRSRLAVAWRR